MEVLTGELISSLYEKHEEAFKKLTRDMILEHGLHGCTLSQEEMNARIKEILNYETTA